MAITIWVLIFVVSSIALTCAAVLTYWEFAGPPGKLDFRLQIWTLLLLMPLALMNWARGILIGFEKPVLFALPDSIFRPLLLLLFVAGLALSEQISAPMVMAAHVLAVALCFVWSAVMAYRTLRAQISPLKFSWRDMSGRAWIKSLIPLSLVKGVRIINRRIDIAMIGILGTTVAVASYNIAVQVVSLILVAQTVLQSVLGPKIAYAHEKGDLAVMRRNVANTTLISCGFAILSVIAILILGRWVLAMLFNDAYGDVYPVILVLSIGQVFSALMGPTALLLNMSRLEKRTLQTGVIAAFINVSLNLILIPILLGMGAAIASSVTMIVIQTQRWWMVKKHVGIRSDILSAFATIRREVEQSASPTADPDDAVR